MCSTFAREDGPVNGWVNESVIQTGKVDPVFNNFGGEERFWFGPEGGQFGLMFGRAESKFSNYCVQPGMSSLAYRVASGDERSVLMVADMTLENNSGTRFQLHVDRRICLLEGCPYDQAAKGKVDFVAFQSENTVTNTGPEAWTREKGTLAMWCLGQFPEYSRPSVIVPVRSGRSARLSPPTVDEYFKDFCLGGVFPSNRRASFSRFVLLKADGKVRGKVGIKKDRATGRLGSYNPDGHHLIIVDHDFYPELDYATGYWRHYDNAFDGDALSVYIDGPEQPGGPEGLSYELETMSPALFLWSGQSFVYRNRTFHMRGRRADIAAICRRFLSARLSEIDAFEKDAT